DNDDDDDEEEISKIDEQEATESGEGDDEETKSDGENSEDTGNDKEDQGLRISEEERMQEEKADKLYRDVNINQGRGLQVSQDIDDSHVTLTPVHSDGQESSSTSSFVTSLLNLIIDPGMESIFTTASSSVAPLPLPTSTMTPSIMTTTTTVKSQVKAQVTRILLRIEESVNAQLEGEVLTRSSHSLRTSYAVAADLSEMELKKILIDKMEGNKEDVRMMMIRKDPLLDQTGGLRDEEKVGSMHQPALHLNQLPGVQAGTKDQPIVQTSQHPEWFSQPRKPPTPDCDWNKTLPAVQGSAQSWINELAKQTDARSSFNELLDTPIDFSNFIMNRLGIDTLTPKLLAGQQYPHNLLQPLPLIPDNRGHRVIPFEHFINNDLEYLQGGASSRKYTTSVTKTKATDYGHIKWIEDLFYGFAVNRESALDVYSKRRIIAVTDLKIVEWHNYKHLDWISVRRDDDKIYKFKEGDFKRLRLQDMEDMLLLFVQGKLSNLTV
nr:hypothetical protein [Tanacetum cinerariifolium]